jgi:putative transposase
MEKERPAGLSCNKFCQYMHLNRSTLYYKPKGESEENLEIMEKIDHIYTEHPTTGVLKMVDALELNGIHVNEKRVRRMMRKMNLMAIYPKKCLSIGGKPKYIHPYLLRNLEITRPNQVWSTDISYIPMQGGFMYQHIYIHPADNVEELRSGIKDYVTYYNVQRPHQSLDGMLPAMKYGIAV